MPSNGRSHQKPARETGRKSDAHPGAMHTTREQSARDTQYDDEYLLGEDDPYASNPPRTVSSAIRLSPPTTRRSSRDMSTETRRPMANIPPRRTQQRQDFGQVPGASAAARPARNVTTTYEKPPARRERRNVHWLLYVGLGMLAALALWALSTSALAWGTNEYNNILYGYPRTFQTNAVVGHNDSPANPSHFIAVNLKGQIIIFELPGGDPSKSTDYIGPDLIGPQDDLLPVTLAFQDVNHDQAPDMVVHVADKNFDFCNNLTARKFQACAQNATP
ncbi:MAG TPA: hypothetical protein VGF67_25925 [Ktedonobacteraceae bacterium]